MTTKRTLGLGAGITVIAATVATPLLAGSAAASAHSFTVRMHSLQDTSVDNGAKGFSPGDDDVQATRLTQGGKTVGWEVGDCLTARVAKTADQVCRFVYHLPKGQLIASGAVRSGPQGPGGFTMAITGGTGTYSSARGEITMASASQGAVPVEVDVRY
jgi:hypothetical protein